MTIFKNLSVSLFLVFGLYGCKENTSKTVESTNQTTTKTPETLTYAEISIKENGSWEGEKYIGGSFVNVSELKVPEKHTDHSGFIRYEGPGWENAQVGYRLYLDWRNAIDIFGKKVDTMVLHQVGHPNSTSYHDDAPWGLDILKAGKSMGLGGFGRYVNGAVAHFEDVGSTRVKIDNAKDRSTVMIDYSQWTTAGESIDLTAKINIFPGDRHTLVELEPSSKISGLSTGIVRISDIPLLRKEDEGGDWGYIATYGKQTLAGDEDRLGMALFYNKDQVERILEGTDDHLVVFKEVDNIDYYFLAAWEQEKEGIKSEGEFIADLDNKLKLLDRDGQLR